MPLKDPVAKKAYDNAYFKQWRLRNKERHTAYVRKSDQKRRIAVRSAVLAEKSKPCKDCDTKYPHYVMQFDHARGTKSFEISKAVSGKRCIEVVLAEMEKCDVVCANCHAERTWQRKHWLKGRSAI